MNIVHINSSVQLITDFLTPSECDSVLSAAVNFKHATVFDNVQKKSVMDVHFRNAEIHYFQHNDPVVRPILERTSTIMGCSVDQIEPLQCVRYETGGQYRPHYDAFFPGTYPERSGNRTHTLILYLNDDFGGGQTFFPHMNLTVRPVKGQAVIWRNTDAAGNILNDSLHAGLPVEFGSKYIIPVWIRERNF